MVLYIIDYRLHHFSLFHESMLLTLCHATNVLIDIMLIASPLLPSNFFKCYHNNLV